MNNQKPDSKSDHEDGDHTQPINLVAARTAVPVSTFSASGTTVSSQPLAMRTHMDNKPGGLMTLYFRTQAPRTQGQVMGPLVGAQVSSSQHFAAKSVIRMPSDITQVQGGTPTSSSGGSLTSGILPSALSGGSTRHMIPTAVQPVIAAGHSGPALASLIRGSHQVSPAGHVIHPPFSSHVPRGPAAVASISSAPKSAVATPILRTPHSSATIALASSSMMALHAPVRVKSPTLAGRTATPPVAASTSLPQVIDLQKSSIGHSLPPSATHVGLSSRSLEGSVVRSGNTHSSSITIAKPVNISQPIVQHLQQVYDKGSLKTVSNLVPSTTVPANSSHQSAFSSVNETTGVPTISRAPVSSSYSSIMQLSSTNVGQPIQQLRTSHLPQGMHAMTSSGTSHQTLTVIAAKSLMPTNHSIALATPTPRSTTPITTVSAAGGNISIVPGPTPRSLTITNTITPATIPVAKVYPQSSITPRTTSETTQENVRSTSFMTQGITSSSARVTTPTTTSCISDKQPENSTVRFTSFTKSPSVSGSSYPPSSTTYLYHDQYASNLTMHQYNSNSSSQSFTTTQLRPVSFSQHSSSNASSHSSLSVSNPVMVAVDSRHHVSLHSPYSGNSGKGSDLPAPVSLSSSGTTTVSNTTATSVVSTSYSTLQSQSTVNNHTSPRPSILRKRPSESICNIAKKNLSGSLNAAEPVSPRPEMSSNVSFTSVLSPKPVSDNKPKEVVSSAIPMVTDSQNILIPIIPAISIKKELDISENSNPPLDSALKDSRPVEASPRKKPRKQLLATNDLIETHSSDGEENNFDVKVKIKEEPGIRDDERSKCITFYKRPSMSLLSTYRQNWKARHNHFARYCDVKPKEEKKQTVSELANQKGILQQANGWKVYHLTAQMDEVIGLEDTVYSRLSDLLEFVENDDSSAVKNWNTLNTDEVRIINKLTDLIKAFHNMRKCRGCPHINKHTTAGQLHAATVTQISQKTVARHVQQEGLYAQRPVVCVKCTSCLQFLISITIGRTTGHGNLQRSKIVQEQVSESKQQAIKVLEHKTNVVEMVNKYVSKRPLKKKDKS